ncbi:iron complex transport system ATP-binding protein [Paracoccus halophilus]|uniref:Iron ABC transporter n=1 Tax=Paracoccus halophilus TaxID=376733 RepID=A0A099F5W6_9RHOB|nr:heme ABC transporter ATP-binding protein [Paracoccus halophilus]KGJ05611.1 iron ABC transporter [Paracoccus halophilus]SFA47400.1 iron complex transport system ATP-binding protein [Paracoccus halophilus]
MSLAARNLAIRLGRALILKGVDLTARAGCLTAIIGPNGSGKTTLLRALTGELAATSGQVVLNGRDIAGFRPHELAALRAVLPQQTALSFPFTATEIVRIGLTSHPGRETDRDDLIRAALAAVGLPGHAGRLYQQLSGGEQQRVQLARALAQVWQPLGDDGPRWLLLDEPVSSLDIAHQLTVMRLAADYARRGGGVIAVMHDLNLTAMFADHLLLMHEGRAMGEGTPAEVLTDDLLSRAYGCRLCVNRAPVQGIWLLPQLASV